MAVTENGFLFAVWQAKAGSSIQVDNDDTSLATSLLAEGIVGYALDQDIDKTPEHDPAVGTVVGVGFSAGVETQFGEDFRLNLHPGLFGYYAKSTTWWDENAGDIKKNSWLIMLTSGPAFRSVISSSNSEQVDHGLFLSVGGAYYKGWINDMALTASLMGAFYGNGVIDVTPTVGLVGDF